MMLRFRAAAAAAGVAVAALLAPTVRAGAQTTAVPAPLAPPSTRMVDVSDNYHGQRVADPYRWLENDTSPAVAAWVEAQNRVTFAYLGQIAEREPIRRRLTTLWNYERYSAPFSRAGRYFYFKNDGLQNQSVLYVQPSLDGPSRVLLDPNTLSSDGTVALSTIEVGPNGRYLVYGTSASGSDWQEFHVREIDKGVDAADRLRWIKFSGASWTKDGGGFFYSRYPEPPPGAAMREANRNQTLYYHAVGRPQSQDLLVYQRPDQPEWGIGSEVTEDGRYAVVNIWQGTDRRNRIYYMDLGDSLRPNIGASVVKLLDDFDASYNFIGNDGSVFYFLTDLDAPRRRVIAIDVATPARQGWREVIPQSPDVLEAVALVQKTFVARYLHDAHSRVRLFESGGAAYSDLPLPGIGTVGGVSAERWGNEFFFTFSSFLRPTTVYRYDFATKSAAVFKVPKVDFDPLPYETEQVFYPSKDGTRVPMFITRRKDLKKDGTAPTYLTAYGGFNINILPSFSTSNLVWLEMGGVIAVPNLRGGGEYGEEWHAAGMREKKQNVFDDFIGAAEYLIREGYTSPAKLAIAGGSNGGLLVGAAMTQRPELFGAALPAVGVMDMLRYHKFTIGWAWAPEYGTADSAAHFAYLAKYSPLHNLRPGTDYPATMVTTADHDDRVVPAHSFKFAAALQAANSGRRPALIRVETKAGHGAGKPTSKIIEEQADRWAFLSRALGMSPQVP